MINGKQKKKQSQKFLATVWRKITGTESSGSLILLETKIQKKKEKKKKRASGESHIEDGKGDDQHISVGGQII